MDKVSMSHVISFSRYQTKCVVKFLFRQFMQSYINLKIFLGSISKAMADREKKEGRRKYKNLNISRTKSAYWMK